MNKFRTWMVLIAIILIITHFIIIDYSNLSWSKNAGSYLGIASMILLIISLIGSHWHEKRNLLKEKQSNNLIRKK